MEEKELRELLALTVNEMVLRTLGEHGGAVAGFAFMTDDDASTLCYAILVSRSATDAVDPDLLFSPTDWPAPADDDSLEALSDWLSSIAADEGPAAHVERVFSVLTDVLAACRERGVFTDAVFLSVLSTDPGPHTEALENDSVRRLNSHETTLARERFLAKWARTSPEPSAEREQ